jgi:2-polyprenyl-3-methyl-5-hydroxy-6-metoxy-1,4-benzoquinol methylase
MRDSSLLEMNDFTERSGCPFCGSDRAQVIGKVYTPRYFVLPKGPYSLSRDVMNKRLLCECSLCGIVYHSLIVKRDTLLRLYDGNNAGEMWKFSHERNVESKIRLMGSLVRGGRILDVGCHTGEFLGNIGDSNLELWGIELSESSSRTAQQKYPVKVLRGAIEEVELPRDYFSGITMWDVLEHVSEVKSAIANVYQALEKGGILLIETGNIKCLPARLLKGNWWYVSLLEHFTFYDRASLRRILSDTGFQLVDVHHTIYATPGVSIFVKTLINACIFCILNGFDREATIYRKAAQLLRKSGCSPPIHWRDHLLAVAKKP